MRTLYWQTSRLPCGLKQTPVGQLAGTLRLQFSEMARSCRTTNPAQGSTSISRFCLLSQTTRRGRKKAPPEVGSAAAAATARTASRKSLQASATWEVVVAGRTEALERCVGVCLNLGVCDHWAAVTHLRCLPLRELTQDSLRHIRRQVGKRTISVRHREEKEGEWAGSGECVSMTQT